MQSHRFIPRAASVIALLAVLAEGGCARTHVARDPAVHPATCAIGLHARLAGDTLTVAVLAPVNPSHVPAPVNDAERLVFAQLYETLIDVDCEGRARPALARSWTLDATRTRVTFTLRDDARFWAGAPLTANDVVAAWRATGMQPTDAGRLARDMADATTILDDRTLVVSLPDTGWHLLADRSLAVYRPAPQSAWPEGSGAYRPGAAPGSDLLLSPVSPADPHLLFRQAGSGDARDAIDAGADVLVTGDPAAVSYATTRAGLSVVPLPWTRTYVLATPSPVAAWSAAPADSGPATLRGSLVHAVRADARPAVGAPWWNALASWPTALAACGLTLLRSDATPDVIPLPPTDRRSNRVLYRRDDDVARGLAERLAALEGSAVAAGLPDGDFARAVRDAADMGYVLELPNAPLSPCRSLSHVHVAAPWLPHGGTIVPLIDVREHAIVRRGAVPATVVWDRTLRFGRWP